MSEEILLVKAFLGIDTLNRHGQLQWCPLGLCKAQPKEEHGLKGRLGFWNSTDLSSRKEPPAIVHNSLGTEIPKRTSKPPMF